MFTFRLPSILPSPVFPGQPCRRNTSDRQHVHPFWFTVILYSLLLQHFSLSWFTPPSPVNSTQEKSAQGAPKIYHQFTSVGHVLGFGAGQVVVGHPTHALTMTLVNAKPVKPAAGSGTDEQVNSRTEDDPPIRPELKHAAKAPQPFIGSVSYDNPWPGVSVIYRAQAGAILKSEYHLSPGFSDKTIASIRIGYNRPVRLNKQGGLIVYYPAGEMIESKPIAWQVIDNRRVPIPVSYRVINQTTVGFSTGPFDPGFPLVIDPALTWNTFLGGAGIDYGYGMALDPSGNVYLTGQSDAAWGSPLQPYSAGGDIYVAKLDANGNLLWHTFFGSAGNDAGNCVHYSSGFIFIGGTSEGTWGSPVRAYVGNDAFAAKLDTSGNLIWNTFLGGTPGLDTVSGIGSDTNGNLYLSGRSAATWGSPLRAFSGSGDILAAKLDSSGNLLWHTFLGGSDDDGGYFIFATNAGNTYITGRSAAAWGTPVRAYTADYDIAVVQLNSSGSILWNTFLGGAGIDYGYAVAVDSFNNVYIGGSSSATWGSPSQPYTGNADGTLAKLDLNGNLVWNTFLGGTNIDYVRSMILGPAQELYFCGYTGSDWGTPWRAFTSGLDVFAAKADSSDGQIIWNAFLGGTGNDLGYGIVIDQNGNLFLGGNSNADWGTPLRSYTASTEGIVIKIQNTTGGSPTHTPSITPTPFITSISTPSATRTQTPSVTASPFFTATPTPSNSPTPSGSPTPLPSPAASSTPTLSPTSSRSSTATAALSFTCTMTRSPYRSATPTATLTSTPDSAWLTAAPTLISSGQNFIRLFSQLIRVSRGDSLSLSLSLSQPVQVNIQLYDLTGRRVMEIMDSQQPAGTQLVTRDLSALGSGTYILLAEAGGQRARFKLVVLR